MKYKEGDKVRFLRGKATHNEQKDLLQLADKYDDIFTISFFRNCFYHIVEDEISYWCFDEKELKLIKEEEIIERKEEINMNYDEILNIYKNRQETKINTEECEAKNEYKDEYELLRDEYNNKLLELLKAEGREEYYDDYKMSYGPTSIEKTLKNDAIRKEYQTKKDDLIKNISEVKAQLKLCTTRDEVNEVLKSYSILKKDGKINA